MIQCKNCQAQFTGKFCSNCGQAADVGRLNMHSLWEDIRGGLFKFNDKLPYTTKQLLMRPGYTIKEYIQGKRQQHLKPMSYLLLMSGLYVLLNNKLHMSIIDLHGDTATFDHLGIHNANEWFLSYFGLINLTLVPVYALFSYAVFKRGGYNYIEHLVINSYMGGLRSLTSLLTFPIIYLTYHTPYLQVSRWIITLISFSLMYWTFAQIFDYWSRLKVFGAVLFVQLLTIMFLILVIAVMLLCF